jgi:predicted  nucleic acid-binding Zn-ribbon protein
MAEIQIHSIMKELINNLLKLQTLQFDETVAESDRRIEALRAKIPAPMLVHYDRLAVRGKKGVAAVRNQVCTGCHVQVPRAVVVTLMHGDDIRICESCGRYLYLPEPTEPNKNKRAKKPASAGEPKPELRAARKQTSN